MKKRKTIGSPQSQMIDVWVAVFYADGESRVIGIFDGRLSKEEVYQKIDERDRDLDEPELAPETADPEMTDLEKWDVE